MRRKVIAAIDVGSHALRLKIGEISKAGDFKEVESYRKIAVLGHDTFTNDKVSFASVDELCETLKLFQNSLRDYQVDAYKAMATSAIREASNRDYIIDQVKLKTGLDVEVISNAQEQFLTHKAVKKNIENYEELIKEGAVIVVVGAGSIQITTYIDGCLEYSQNIKMGALRIKEILHELESKSISYNTALKEYIDMSLEGVAFFTNQNTYKHLIAVGGEMGIIREIVEFEKNVKDNQISRKQFNKLFQRLLDMQTEEIREMYDIKRERAEIIIPSMMLFAKFLEKVTSNKIITPQISLTDGIIQYLHEELYDLKEDEENIADILTNAEVLARKFHTNIEHTKKVEEHALAIFDRLAKSYGMVEDRILLRVAASLHEVGRAISIDKMSENTYFMIKSLEVFGLSKKQLEIIANITYYLSLTKNLDSNTNFEDLDMKERVVVSKLVGILRLADAMD